MLHMQMFIKSFQLNNSPAIFDTEVKTFFRYSNHYFNKTCSVMVWHLLETSCNSTQIVTWNKIW